MIINCLFLILVFVVMVQAKIFPEHQIRKDSISLTMPLCMIEGGDSMLYIGGNMTPAQSTGKVVKYDLKTGKVVKEFPGLGKEIRSATSDGLGNVIFAGHEVYFFGKDSIVRTLPAPTSARIGAMGRAGEKIYVAPGDIYSLTNDSFTPCNLGENNYSRDMVISGNNVIWVAGSGGDGIPFVSYLKSDGGWYFYDTSNQSFKALVQKNETEFKNIQKILFRDGEILMFGSLLFGALNTSGACQSYAVNFSPKTAAVDNSNIDFVWFSDANNIYLYNLKTKTHDQYGLEENGFPSCDPFLSVVVIYPSKTNKNIIYFGYKNRIFTYSKDASGILPSPVIKFDISKPQAIYNLRGQKFSAQISGSFKNLPKGVYFHKLPDGRRKILHIK